MASAETPSQMFVHQVADLITAGQAGEVTCDVMHNIAAGNPSVAFEMQLSSGTIRSVRGVWRATGGSSNPWYHVVVLDAADNAMGDSMAWGDKGWEATFWRALRDLHEAQIAPARERMTSELKGRELG